jgi:peptidyl-tRNA hydrolase, PTH1 family
MRLSFQLFGRAKSSGPAEWLIAGLGNPGRQYVHNRHNAGFHVIERLAEQHQLNFDERREQVHMARGVIEGVKVALVKPQTFMNLSGKAIGALARFYKVPTERILVVYDDLDLPLGALRLRDQGGSGGHRGMASIIDHLNSQAFPRIRVGIGRPPGRMAPEVYVLQDFDAEQWAVMEQTYAQAVAAIHSVLREGFQTAMNQFNSLAKSGNYR